MVSFAPTSEETLEDQRLYTQARLTEVACLDCLARVGVKKNSEHHTSIQWNAEALEQCAEFRKMASEPGGPARLRELLAATVLDRPRRRRRRDRDRGHWMATESFVLKVLDVVEETADAHSIVFEVPDDAAGAVRLHARASSSPSPCPSDQTGPRRALLLAVRRRRTRAGTRSR